MRVDDVAGNICLALPGDATWRRHAKKLEMSGCLCQYAPRARALHAGIARHVIGCRLTQETTVRSACR
jgi:hypothetical protein